MTDIERIELAIRRVLDNWAHTDQRQVGPIDLLAAVADELARMIGEQKDEYARGYSDGVLRR